MTSYVYTAKAEVDGVGKAGERANLEGKYPLDYLLLHAYVQAEEAVFTGALASPGSNGSVESPKSVKPKGTTK